MTVRRMILCPKCGWTASYTGKPDVEGRVCPRCGNPWLIIEGDEL